MAYTQADRHIAIETPLGADRLLLAGLTGEEHVSRLFRFEADLLSEDHRIEPADIVGKPVAMRIRRADGGDRWVHGHVAEFRTGWTVLGNLRRYHAEVVPWFWFLTNHVDCRIFQDMSVVEIAESIFADFEFSDYDISFVKETHPRWEYCTQYQESSFDFLNRLFEHQGIFWFFRHEADRHTLVLADVNQAFAAAPEADAAVRTAEKGLGVVTDWHHRYRFHAGRYSTSDYNFVTPELPLRSDRKLLQPFAGMARFEKYEWPGDYYTREEGDALVRHRLEEEEAGHHRVEGASTCPSFAPGTKVAPAGHPNPVEDARGYALLSVAHTADEPSYLTRDGKPGTYRNSFTAFPLVAGERRAPLTFRPPRRTPTPTITGIQTAVVVGPPGETIHTDTYARVRVQFHWDRHGRKDERSSCWVRVSQAWAGKGYGALQLPHVGQEVIVAFLEGDPDRPLIVGRVFNAGQSNPLLEQALSEKTKSITRDQGGNQIVTQGKEGDQVLRMHSPASNTHFSLGTLPADMPTPDLPPGIPGPPGGFPAAGGGGGVVQAQAAQPSSPRSTGKPKLRETLAVYASDQAGGERMGHGGGQGASHQQQMAVATSLDSTKETTAGQTADAINAVPGIGSWTAGPSIDSSSYKLIYVNGDTVTVTIGDSYRFTRGNTVSQTQGATLTETLGPTFTTFVGPRMATTLAADIALTAGVRMQAYLGGQLNAELGVKLTSVVGQDVKILGDPASAAGIIGGTVAAVALGYSVANLKDGGNGVLTTMLSGAGAAGAAAIAAAALSTVETKLYPTATVLEFGMQKLGVVQLQAVLTNKDAHLKTLSSEIAAKKSEIAALKSHADVKKNTVVASENVAAGMSMKSRAALVKSGATEVSANGLLSLN